MLAFVISLDDVVITFFTAGPGSTTLPLYIFGQLKFGYRLRLKRAVDIVLAIALIMLTIAECSAPGPRSAAWVRSTHDPRVAYYRQTKQPAALVMCKGRLGRDRSPRPAFESMITAPSSPSVSATNVAMPRVRNDRSDLDDHERVTK